MRGKNSKNSKNSNDKKHTNHLHFMTRSLPARVMSSNNGFCSFANRNATFELGLTIRHSIYNTTLLGVYTLEFTIFTWVKKELPLHAQWDVRAEGNNYAFPIAYNLVFTCHASMSFTRMFFDTNTTWVSGSISMC